MSQKEFFTSGVDGYVKKNIQLWDIPGLMLTVVKNGETVLKKGYGFQNIDSKSLVDENTLYAIGSCTKAFTTAALAILVDEGKIDWDGCVIDYLPNFRLYDPYVTRELTIRDILTHRSGLSRHDPLWYGSGYDQEDIVHRMRFLKPSHRFRDKADYQNLMYLVAGQIIQSVTGLSWDDFVTQRIFKPLGMKSSFVGTSALNPQENMAKPCAVVDKDVKEIPRLNIDNIAPAGSIISNAVDMVKWIKFQLSNGTFQGKKIICENSMKEMHEPQFLLHNWDQIKPIREALSGVTNIWTSGLGWIVTDYRGQKMSLHQGGIDGMSSFIGLISNKNIGVFVVCNLNDSLLPLPMMLKLIDAALDIQEPEWCEMMLPFKDAQAAEIEEQYKKISELRVKDAPASLDLSQYTGTYGNDAYGDSIVTMEDKKFKLTCNPILNAELEHWHYNTFRVVWAKATHFDTFLTFSLDFAGNVDGLKLYEQMDMPPIELMKKK